MKIDKQIIEPYKEFLSRLPMLDIGIQRLYGILSWPKNEIPNEINVVLYPTFEYISFVEGVKVPFFKLLEEILSSKVDILFKHVINSQLYNVNKLTYDEAFDFLIFTGKENCRKILDNYEKLSSAKYTDIINAIISNDCMAFKNTLNDFDCTDFMCALWTIRFILYGIYDSIENKTGSSTIHNHWLNGESYSFLFKNILEGNEDAYYKEQILRISGVHMHKKRQRISDPYTNITSYDILDSKYKHYDKDMEDYLFHVHNKTTYKRYINELYTKQEAIADQCHYLVTSIIVHALKFHKSDIAEKLLTRTRTASSNCVVVGKIDPKVLMPSIDINEDKKAERYKFNENQRLAFLEAIEDLTWEYGADIYKEIDIKLFRDYILLFLNRIGEVLHLITPILDDNETAILHWIIRRTNYTIRDDAGLQEKSQNELQEYKKVLTIDNNESHKTWFKTVLYSKVNGKNIEEKQENLYCNLEKLYSYLSSPNKGYIDPLTDKNLFIYRFSGFNDIHPPKDIISWNGKNILLGYIIRCLFSDNAQEPELKDVAGFFISKSGKQINLASARYIEGSNFDTEKNRLPKLFVEAVEILRGCGFVNVEFTKKRR